MVQLINRNYESVLQNGGDTANVPLPPTMRANNISETGSVQLQAASLGSAVVLNKHVEASFQIQDVARVLSVPEWRQQAHGNPA